MIRKPGTSEFRTSTLESAAYKTGLVIDKYAPPRPDRVSEARARTITWIVGVSVPVAALSIVIGPLMSIVAVPPWVFGILGPVLFLASLLLMTFVHSRLSPSSYDRMARDAAAQIAEDGKAAEDYYRRSVARPVWYVVGRLLRTCAMMALIFWFFLSLAKSGRQEGAAIMLAIIVAYVMFDALLNSYRKRVLGKAQRGRTP